MYSLQKLIAIIIGVCIFTTSAYAYYDPNRQSAKPDNNKVNFREACTTAKDQVDQNVNNVRARLTTGGDVWWDRSEGKYVVPVVEPGEQEVSSIFAGAVWLGGVDPGGNLKVACQQYGNASNQSDFWSGPLDDETGGTDKIICDLWDRFFEVQGSEIDEHLRLYEQSLTGEIDYTEDLIPLGVKGWPGDGNPYFFSVHNFDLPVTLQGLAGFWDADADNVYDPLQGDYPVIEIRGCSPDNIPGYVPQYPDEMIFWIYNDEGGGAIHGETEGLAIRMEVQVQAFAYATNDQINNMTFQRYKLINRAKEDIDSTFFAMWVDPDLGCYIDDYIGCDTSRSLAYAYNEDAEDGDPQCTGIGVYGEKVPIIGVDYFRGPLDEFGVELGMSSFTYFNNPSFGEPAPGINTTDPQFDFEYYNYLSGTWRDRTPFSFGGDGYDPSSTEILDFAFTSDPDDQNGWSMCTEDLPGYDRRTVQASGPFTLQPGAVNELIIGAVWVPDLDYPCPNISRLQKADDIAQNLFDSCFDLVDGPDAPDVDWIELDQELIAVFTNSPISNNYLEQYEEQGIGFPKGVSDSTYNFEGYVLYQLAGPNVSIADLDDPNQARLVYQVDLNNDIATMYNWESVENPTPDLQGSPEVFFPVVEVEGANQGIRHTFRISEDQFATGDRRLINHRRYYFTALAYAHNEYEPFDFQTQEGQALTYIEGRRNIRTYRPIPRPINDRSINAGYGDGPIVTRIDGVGVGGNFVDISDESRDEILSGDFDGDIVYKEGRGPINVTIFNPLDVIDGDYELTFVDENMTNSQLDQDVNWQLTNLNTGEVVESDRSIDILNEQIFGEYGFTITIGQTADVGEWADPTDGGIGYDISYESLERPIWFSGIPDGFTIEGNDIATRFFDYVEYNEDWEEREHQVLAQIGPGYFLPYQICDIQDRGINFFYYTPAWRDYAGGEGDLVQKEELIQELNNVNIVLTPNKDLWSRCPIVETMPPEFTNFGVDIEGNPILADNDVPSLVSDPIQTFDLRGSLSVGKDDTDGDGLPDPDGATDANGVPMIGMGWFPGYAIDVETGKRLVVFFGENSAYRTEVLGDSLTTEVFGGRRPVGDDMMFNPTDQVTLTGLGAGNFYTYYGGGQHYIYVTTLEYNIDNPPSGEVDNVEYLRGRLDSRLGSELRKLAPLQQITWTSWPIMQTGTRMRSYSEGLIPNEATVRLRVDNPYAVEEGTGEFNGYPTYRFKVEGKQADPLDEIGLQEFMDEINVVPNPYYAYSEYETDRLATVVKITNLPARATITIYSLDGKFIRQYNRDETPGIPTGSGIRNNQIIPDLEWDLKNNKGVPVAAGVYLIHVVGELQDEAGNIQVRERTLKWFGINRKFDPSGL